jgi:hypothetical protein
VRSLFLIILVEGPGYVSFNPISGRCSKFSFCRASKESRNLLVQRLALPDSQSPELLVP